MSPKNSLTSVRVPAEIKDKAASILAECGLTVSDATRMLLTKIVTDGALPPFLVMSEEQYDVWFREKVKESIEDTSPRVSSAEVMASVKERRKARLSEVSL
jgi:DNA-damage-inducible protein J